MHEIGIARQILRTVERFAAENGVDGIDEVVCDNGELSLVIPEYLEKTYPMVVKGTILQEAKLTLNTVPGLAECDDCDEIFNVVEHKGYCPSCGSFRKTVLSGKTFSVKEIIVKETTIRRQRTVPRLPVSKKQRSCRDRWSLQDFCCYWYFLKVVMKKSIVFADNDRIAIVP